MPERQDDWRDAQFIRGIRDHMPGVEIRYVAPGQQIKEMDVHVADLTLEGLVLKVVEYAVPRGAKVVTYRAVLFHGGKYHGFIGVET